MSSSITLRFVAPATGLPTQRLCAGQVLQWIDQAGSACAVSWAKRPCVAVFMGNLRFRGPVTAGQLVEVEARLAYTGNTSINLVVEVRTRPLAQTEFQIVTECLVVYVAPDNDGKPQTVDAWSPSTPGEVALAEHARAFLRPAGGVDGDVATLA